MEEVVLDAVSLDSAVVVLPVRHHSPGCAWHVARVIRDLRPDVVMAEGPSNANDLTPFLLHERTVPPVAFYAYVRPSADQPASASFYPFCDYSPEYVAVRTARELGIDFTWIDLPSWQMDFQVSENVRNAYADGALRHHAYLEALCEQSGVRDFDEWWDRHFEASAVETSSESFFTSIATYGRAARAHTPEDVIADEGNLVREQAMAGHIRQAADAGKRVVAVVGAFHRMGIEERLRDPSFTAAAPAKPPKDHGLYLSIYSYQRLDRWSGYDAGMPAPAFQHSAWTSMTGTDTSQGSTKLLADLAKQLRQSGEPVSTAELISAGSMLEGLRQFRGHHRPTLADLRDAVTATWVKQADGDGSHPVVRAVERRLIGDRMGRVVEDAGRPPIVEDFYHQVRMLKLGAATGPGVSMRRREVKLDIYRQPTHRRRSAFLHRLLQLDCPYGRKDFGPDFVAGNDLDRVREQWTVEWKPELEAILVEQAIRGSSIEEAARQSLIESLAEEATLRSAKAVELLTAALVMDFSDLSDDLIERTRQAIETEPDFAESAAAMSQLIHLVRYQLVLGADRLDSIQQLIPRAYQRAIWLIDSLPGIASAEPAEEGPNPIDHAMQGLVRLRHAVLVAAVTGLDGDLFTRALDRVSSQLGSQPLLLGTVMGILVQLGQRSADDLRQAMEGVIRGTRAGLEESLGDFLRGLFAVRHHAILEDPLLLQGVDHCVSSLDEEAFLRVLPGLRLAFSTFTPRDLRQLTIQLSGPDQSVNVGDNADRSAVIRADQLVEETLRSLGIGDSGGSSLARTDDAMEYDDSVDRS